MSEEDHTLDELLFLPGTKTVSFNVSISNNNYKGVKNFTLVTSWIRFYPCVVTNISSPT